MIFRNSPMPQTVSHDCSHRRVNATFPYDWPSIEAPPHTHTHTQGSIITHHSSECLFFSESITSSPHQLAFLPSTATSDTPRCNRSQLSAAPQPVSQPINPWQPWSVSRQQWARLWLIVLQTRWKRRAANNPPSLDINLKSTTIDR